MVKKEEELAKKNFSPLKLCSFTLNELFLLANSTSLRPLSHHLLLAIVRFRTQKNELQVSFSICKQRQKRKNRDSITTRTTTTSLRRSMRLSFVLLRGLFYY